MSKMKWETMGCYTIHLCSLTTQEKAEGWADSELWTGQAGAVESQAVFCSCFSA